MTDLTVIILTQDEALHIARAIRSVRSVATQVLVVDSGSTDDTCAIARAEGAKVLTHPWTTHAAQVNWALDQIQGQGGWVLRLDADEIASPDLIRQIKLGLPDVAGIFVDRSLCFMGQPVRYGGLFPVPVLRLFRQGLGRCEDRWMDEHIVVTGQTARLRGAIIDDNRKPLDWWITKHNAYASREVVDILTRGDDGAAHLGRGAARRRWLKTRVYGRLPGGVRAGVYFFYRFILRGGFRDGPRARAFHVLQGFWYRYLVDAKLAEVRRYMAQNRVSPQVAIGDVLGVTLSPTQSKEEKEAA